MADASGDNPHRNIPAPPGGFAKFLELERVHSADGCARLELTVQDKHLRSLDILHGGVMAALLDSAMGVGCSTLAPDDHYVVTIQLNVNFIRPAWKGERLIATSETLHSGKQTAVVRAEVKTSDGQLAGTGSATFLFIPHTERTRTGVLKG